MRSISLKLNLFANKNIAKLDTKQMEAAFDRLTTIQKENVNKHMFAIAYNCVAKSKEEPEILKELVKQETKSCPHLASDLTRYCRLVNSVK